MKLFENPLAICNNVLFKISIVKYKIISKIQKEGNNPSDRENVSENDEKCFT